MRGPEAPGWLWLYPQGHFVVDPGVGEVAGGPQQGPVPHTPAPVWP